jgi:hypothetical protein
MHPEREVLLTGPDRGRNRAPARVDRGGTGKRAATKEAPMSEFDKLKDEADKEVKEHPEQVGKAEQALSKKAGVLTQDNEAARQDQGGQPHDSPEEDHGDE